MVLLTEGTSIHLCLLKEHVLHLASRSSPFNAGSKPLHCLSHCSRSLRRGSAAARLLGLRSRIQTGAWMSASCECCVCCQVGVSTTGWFQRSPTKRGVSECDCAASIMRRSWPIRGRCVMEKKVIFYEYKNRIYTSLIRLFVKLICLYIYHMEEPWKLRVLPTLGVYEFESSSDLRLKYYLLLWRASPYVSGKVRTTSCALCHLIWVSKYWSNWINELRLVSLCSEARRFVNRYSEKNLTVWRLMTHIWVVPHR